MSWSKKPFAGAGPHLGGTNLNSFSISVGRLVYTDLAGGSQRVINEIKIDPVHWS